MNRWRSSLAVAAKSAAHSGDHLLCLQQRPDFFHRPLWSIDQWITDCGECVWQPIQQASPSNNLLANGCVARFKDGGLPDEDL
jgi:hypothetical protein